MQISWLRQNTELDLKCFQNGVYLGSAGQGLRMGLLNADKNLHLLIVYMQISSYSKASRSGSTLLYM